MKADLCRFAWLFGILALALVVGCGGDDDDDNDDSSDDDVGDDAGDDDGGSLVLTSTSFTDGGDIPATYTCDNADYDTGLSPQLSWEGAPEGTLYYALTVFDPDAGDTEHWGVFDISADVTSFDEGMRPEGSLPGTAWETLNYMGEAGYAGPCPPEGDGAHHYVFTLYALDEAMPDFTTTPTLSDMIDLIQERSLGSSTLTGLYSR